MKTAINTEQPPLVSGAMPTTNVGISDDPEDQQMILNVLTNTLYTDKVAAVLREYACNAADANVEAGRGDQPIDVRLPNRLDATVSIRDYGFGMTQEQVEKVFCRLGRSTKRGSNAYTGMLGIGSKAGFAYGDHFVVVSYSGGRKTIYNLYRDQGNLRCAKMYEAASDEADGVEIKVPVKTVDMNEFATKAERVYRYFKVRPKITGANLIWVDKKQQYAGNGWRYVGGGTSVAIMGNVGYSIDSAGMGLASSSYSSDKYSSLVGLGVELDFDIGELEIAANREGLQYRDNTKAMIKARLDVVVAEISAVFTNKIAGARSLWEAKIMYHDNFEMLDQYSRHTLKQVVSGVIKWNNAPLTDSEFSVENRTPKDPDISVIRVTKAYKTLRNHTDPWTIHARDYTTLVINDLPTKHNSPSRMRGWFASNPLCREVVLFTFRNPAAEKKFWRDKKLTNAPYTLLSTIPPLVTASAGTTSAHNSKHSAKVFFINESLQVASTAGARSNWWSADKVDYKDGAGVYVTIDGFRVMGVGKGQEPWDFLKDVRRIRDAGLITTPVYGFKPDRAAKVGAKWVKLEVAVKTNLDALVAKKAFAQELSDFLVAESYDQLIDPRFEAYFPNGTPVWTLLHELKRMRNPKSSKALMQLVHSGMCKPWMPEVKLPAATIDLDKLEADVLKSYSLMEHIGKPTLQTTDTDMIKAVSEYVRLIEAAK